MTKVKICGVTNLEDAQAAVEAGADAVGLNFYPPSPRCVDLNTAREIAAALPPFVTRVGIFVDRDLEERQRIAAACGLDAIQLHGQETPAECQAAGPWRSVIKAFRVRGPETLEELAAYAGVVQAWLLDTYVRGQPGGTGETFNWGLAVEARRRFPHVPLILAGGLTPENVAEAVQWVQPYAVDVAGGVEREPGRKDYDRMWEFVRRAKNTGREPLKGWTIA